MAHQAQNALERVFIPNVVEKHCCTLPVSQGPRVPHRSRSSWSPRCRPKASLP